MLSLAKDFLFRPERAADRCRERAGLREAVLIYLVWAVASLLFARFVPLDRLEPSAASAAAHPPGFWLRVALWEPVIVGLGVAVTTLTAAWMRGGWLPLKTASATLMSALPLILAILFARTGMSKAVFAGLLAAWAVPVALLIRRVKPAEWREMGAFLLGINALPLATLPALAAVVLAGSYPAYMAVALVTTLWMLRSAGRGIARLSGASTARAVLAFLLGFFATLSLVMALFFLGALPLEVLKVLVYV